MSKCLMIQRADFVEKQEKIWYNTKNKMRE